MKKTLLLATTAIVSAFAFNVKAEPVTATFDTRVNIVDSLSATATKALDFGTVQAVRDGTATVSVDASGNASGTAIRYIDPSAGVITIHHSGSIDEDNPVSLVFSDVTNLVNEDGTVCGTIDTTSFVQGKFTHVDHNDYEIPFGATLTLQYDKGFYKLCTGTGVATIVRNID